MPPTTLARLALLKKIEMKKHCVMVAIEKHVNKRIIMKIFEWPIKLPYLTRTLSKQITENKTQNELINQAQLFYVLAAIGIRLASWASSQLPTTNLAA